MSSTAGRNKRKLIGARKPAKKSATDQHEKEKSLEKLIDELLQDHRNWSDVALFSQNPPKNEERSKPSKEELPEPEVFTDFSVDYDIDSAVQQSRLELNARTNLERVFFRKQILFASDLKFYLDIRNSILKLWLNNPHTRVKLYQDIIHPRRIIDLRKVKFAKKIYKFLERFGYINFGVFSWEDLKHYCVNVANRGCKVAVIGAGIAGLVTARQLTYFGFDVILIEASKRMGGRCYSFYNEEHFIDLGCTFISGVLGNPFHTLLRQISISAKKLSSQHKLFMNSNEVHKAKNYMVQSIFLSILTFCQFMSLKKKLNSVQKDKLISVEQMFSVIRDLIQSQAKTIKQKGFKDIYDLSKEASGSLEKLLYHERVFLKSAKEIEVLSQTDITQDLTEMFREINFNQITMSYMSASQLPELKSTYESFAKRLTESYEKLNPFVKTHRFFGNDDLRIIQWYLAVMEFQSGVKLDDYSLPYFAKEDFHQSGSQYYCIDSYATILNALCSYDNITNDKNLKENNSNHGEKKRKGTLKKNWNKNQRLKVSYNMNNINGKESNEKINHPQVHTDMTVRSIEVHEKYVIIDAEKRTEYIDLAKRQRKCNVRSTLLKVDAVVCTVPLGVLKKSVSPQCQNDANRISFNPPLNPQKVSAIKRLGLGTVNKVCLCFETNFWIDRLNGEYFGNITAVERQSRGEFVFYFNLGNKDKLPTVTSYLCGQAAEISEKVNDVLLVSRCYHALKEAMGEPFIPRPIKYSVSRWHSHPLFCGTHSYMSVRSNSKDVLTVAYPFALEGGKPRLFFAGEHTCPKFIGTAHGAFLSGLRAAADVANTFDPIK